MRTGDGKCISDIATLVRSARLFRLVGVVASASDSTCWRVLDATGESDVAELRGPGERQPMSPGATRRGHRDRAAAVHGCRADAGELRVL